MSFELNRRLVARRPALATSITIDAVTASIVNGAFETICFEVATHLGRAASMTGGRAMYSSATIRTTAAATCPTTPCMRHCLTIMASWC